MSANPNASLAYNETVMSGILGATGFTAVTSFLNNPASSGNQSGYDAVVSFLNTQVPSNGGVVLILDDGTVIYDSGKTNTYANYAAKSINENHNTRPEILNAILSASGIGVSTRHSSSNGVSRKYYAVRLGDSPQETLGILRVSQNVLI